MRRLVGVCAGLCLLVGVVVLLYPSVSGWWEQQQMKQAVEEFQLQGSLQSQENDTAQQSPSSEDSQEVFPQLWTDMQAYNARIYQEGQSGLVDAWSYEQPVFDIRSYGLSTDVVGILEIPAMDQQLPIYLGATQENMAKGVVVLGQTSMPLGGINTNCVIAGHRGNGSVDIFRDIQVLEPGEQVYVTTYWGELTYQVESTTVIRPDEIDAVLIQEGRDLLTLVTCHPYPENTYRYVVYCSAVDKQGESTQIQGKDTQGTEDREEKQSSSEVRIQLERWLPFAAIPLVIIALGLILWPRNKERPSPRKGKEKE